jgi:phytol kinase
MLERLGELLLPEPGVAAWLAAAGLGFSLALGAGCGRLRLAHGWSTACTRKLFHLLVFTFAAAIHFRLGLPAVSAFGAGVSAAVGIALLRGTGHPFYEALARASDAPQRSWFVLLPLLTTALGGLLASLAVGNAAPLGYLAAGWGDAAGEPVGRTFGRHPYRIAGLRGVTSGRTLEGSAAVALVAAGVAALGLGLGFGAPPARALGGGLSVGLATAAVEAVSPHGFDNLTTIAIAALVTSLFT